METLNWDIHIIKDREQLSVIRPVWNAYFLPLSRRFMYVNFIKIANLQMWQK